MDTKDPLEEAQQALAFEGYERVTPEFDVTEVDALTRWVAAVAIEKAAGRRFTDEQIQEARTLADLLNAHQP